MNYDKALEFMQYEYNRTMDFHGEDYLRSFEGIADILDELGYNVEYRITALFLKILEDTDASKQDVMKYGSMQMLVALDLMRKPKNCEKMKYLLDMKRNMIAFPVKMAEHIYRLKNTEELKEKQIENLIHETEDYYLKCAHDTIFYEPMFQALVEAKKVAGMC